MSDTIRFCLVLHNHQPVGNFDGVFEQAYHDSYRPFLDVFESYDDLRLSLHTSGPLMEWLEERHPEYVDRLARLVAQGRVEIVGGPFYEPILTMIPSRDRLGQIRRYRQWLEQRLNATIQGVWMPERVWEQSLTADLSDAGVRYTLLDDFHFRNAGLSEDELFSYFVTEDDGRTLLVFPGSERLRYLIPFDEPQKTVDYLRDIAARHHDAVVVFGDDGEKFGTWPETKKHVYDDGWLRRFFDALAANRDWLHTTTLAEAADHVPPAGKIYLPDGSYREMTEWVLPVQPQMEYEDVRHEMEHDPHWPRIRRFVRGGFWRNFKVKYPEANEMYSRMMSVSRRLETARQAGIDPHMFDQAQRALYRGQCNCSYWHGAFGGIYLPHLRNAIYRELITADTLIDRALGKVGGWVEATADDFNHDLRQEVRLANDRLLAWLAPSCGGQMYELDVRSIAHNLLATLSRRPEAYHRKVLAGAGQGDKPVASIHDRVVFKQADLDQRLQYDSYSRKSLIDHFWADESSLDQVRRGEARELGDFVAAPYDARIRRDPERIQVQLSREGHVEQHRVKITKGITLHAGSPVLQIGYLLENLPSDRPLHFAVEFNLSGLPAGADNRYYHRGDGQRLGQLGSSLELFDEFELGLSDEWLGIDVRLSANQPTHVWTFPIETVSQSEGGFELVHQSAVVMPHWRVIPDNDGRWSIVLELAIDTNLAESRLDEVEHIAAS
jgi:4-alpha-glucanotransferase